MTGQLELEPGPWCSVCGSPAVVLRGRPTLDDRYPVVRCRRNGHTLAGTRDEALAGRIRAAWLERTAPAPAAPEPGIPAW